MESGGRNVELTRIAGALRKKGMSPEEIEAHLLNCPERCGLPAGEVRQIARSIGRKPAPPPAPAQSYLSNLDPVDELASIRGWKASALRALGATSSPAHREVSFPMRGAQGKQTGQRKRRSDNTPFRNGKKAICNKGDKNGFISPWPFPSDQTILITEGEADAAAALSAGMQAVIATPGAKPGLHVVESLQSLLAGRDCVLAPDPDADGEKWKHQLGKALTSAGCSVRFIPPLDQDLDKRLQRETDRAQALAKMIDNAISYNGLVEKNNKLVKEEHWNDLTNAKEFSLQHVNRVAFVPEAKSWYVYSPETGIWETDVEGLQVQELGKITARQWWERLAGNGSEALAKHAVRSNSRNGIRYMLELARSESSIATSIHQFDQNHFALPVENGVLDLTTGRLSPHSPSHRLTKRSPIRFDHIAKAPRFHQFLEEIFDGNSELINYLHRLVGYFLTGATKEQMFAIFYGSGCNGKSVLIGILEELLGKFAFHADSDFLIESKYARKADEAQPGLLQMMGKRLVVCTETSHGRRLNESLLKQITGQDRVNARGVYGKLPIEFQPTHKLILVTNHRPRASDDPALWRRVRLIPFSVSFEDRKDGNLDQKLKMELSGILNWALEGCLLWQKESLNCPPIVTSATAEYRKSEDVVGQFVAEMCIIGPAFREQSRHLYDSFKQWSEDAGTGSYSAKWFAHRLEEFGFSREGTKPIYRRGLRLRDAYDAYDTTQTQENPSRARMEEFLGTDSDRRHRRNSTDDPTEHDAIQHEQDMWQGDA